MTVTRFKNFRTLRGRRIAVLAADGFERVELTVPVAALRLAGAQVDIISLRRGRIRGVNLHEQAGRVRVDHTFEADPREYDGLLIPGGLINPDLLRQSAEARHFARSFDQARKPIAALCHAPWVLASAGCLAGRTITAWPGIRDDMVHAGATWLDQDVVRDGNLVTSRGPQDLLAFIRAIKELFAESNPIRRPATQQKPSAPQRNEPPHIMIAAMKWIPRPSLRTALLGAVAIGLAAQRRKAHRSAKEDRSPAPEATSVGC